ncbi:hypothetical protein OAJ42_00935 [Flavobacteriales bacterium]|nr:hypothetical protein [Flavobacteriales bacterium]
MLLAPSFLISQCLSGDCENGFGEYKFKNGVYEGNFVAGDLFGQGTFTTKRGYSYEGQWNSNKKGGFAKEIIKKGGTYKGNFSNNLRHGSGEASLPNNRFMDSIIYAGQWENGSMCGKGEMSYNREIKKGRTKIIERNRLVGQFVNGIYQGRQTSSYSDELIWEPYRLKAEQFKAIQNFSEKEYKKLKNLATVDGEIVVSCACSSGVIVFDTHAILRKESSWWSSKIPVKTKSTFLETMQKNFDIMQWHALELKNDLNKQELVCDQSSLPTVWSQLLLKNKELIQTRKLYSIETAWNPLKGTLKNQKTQDKWNRKIQKNISKYKKINQKTLDKLNKKTSKSEKENCFIQAVNVEQMPTILIKSTNSEVGSKKETKKKNSGNKNKEKSEAKKAKDKAEKELKAKKSEAKKAKEKAEKELKAKKAEEKKIKEELKAKEKAAALILKKQKQDARKLKRSLRSYDPKFPRSKQLE